MLDGQAREGEDTSGRDADERRNELPDHLVAMVRRLPPQRAPVVEGSTPVVAFGDPRRAEVATLGINPSAKEFVDKDGELLAGDERRLATLDSLGAERLDALSDAQVATVVHECATYFHRNPYRLWFDPLDAVLNVGAQASYYDGSACHLDLVQWATDPVWGQINDAAVRQALLDDGVPHLQAQLTHDNVRLVVVNGRQVLKQVTKLGLADLEEVGHISAGKAAYCLYAGVGGGVRWLGWSVNLQSSRGISAAFKRELASWLAEQVSETEQAPAATSLGEVDSDGHLRQGLQVAGKAGLVALLRQWLAESSASTLGDVGTFGGRAWLSVDVGGHAVVLNADTKRSAVAVFVREHEDDPERPWRVVANNRGRVNKVLPWPSAEPLPGWYAYLTRPLPEEGAI